MRTKNGLMRYGWRLAALALVGSIAVGCDDEPTEPFVDELMLPEGVSVFLTVDDARAPVGSVVSVAAKVSVVDVDLTPTAYTVGLGYDPERLEPVEAERLVDSVLRSVNLNADPGTVLAAGSAASGLEDGTMFRIGMKVKRPDYVETLAIDLRELIVLERNFADVAPDVIVLSRPFSVDSRR